MGQTGGTQSSKDRRGKLGPQPQTAGGQPKAVQAPGLQAGGPSRSSMNACRPQIATQRAGRQAGGGPNPLPTLSAGGEQATVEKETKACSDCSHSSHSVARG